MQVRQQAKESVKLYINIIFDRNSVTKTIESKNMSYEAKNKLHSGMFHPILRKLQEANVEINPHNLMYPIFLV